jgi:peptidoglycan/LPS O-acetylase OafA/YrhL
MRLLFLDSIRGIAAFVVFLSHLFSCFLFAPSPSLNKITQNIIFFDGRFAVSIFFVLSGMSLSINYISSTPPPPRTHTSTSLDIDIIKKMIVQRFFRLALPIAMTSIIIAMLVNFSLMVNLDIENKFANYWIKLFYHVKEISFYQWFSFSFYDSIILHGTDKHWLANSINPVLWTMPIEFAGSMLVFLVIFCFGRDKRRWIAYTLLALYYIIFNSYLFHFILGIIASEIYVKYNNWTKPANVSHIYDYISLVFLLCLLALYGTYHPRAIWASGLASFSIIILCISNNRIIWLLEKPFFLFLGKICFTLYLIHLPVITSLSSYLVVRLGNLPITSTICIVGSMTIVVCLASAWLLSFFERSLMRLYKRILV